LDTDKLLAFINVAETNSFSKVADQLFLNQPTISARIRVLEEELEVELFERSKGKGVKLSSYGKLFCLMPKKLLR
jgi:LysR family transcriptional regulator, low CO2-responsive transcriptional regulator